MKALMVLIWLPTLVLGQVLSAVLFRNGTFGEFVFFLAWLPANTYAAYKLCEKDGEILVIRLISFVLFTIATLAVVLLRFG